MKKRQITVTLTLGEGFQRAAVRLAVLAPLFLAVGSSHFHDPRSWYQKAFDEAKHHAVSATEGVKCVAQRAVKVDPISYNYKNRESGLEKMARVPEECAPRGMRAWRVINFFRQIWTLNPL